MKRLAVLIIILALAIAGCGGSRVKTAQVDHCSQYKANSQAWAQSYANGLPSTPDQATMRRLAAATYKATAAAHGENCP